MDSTKIILVNSKVIEFYQPISNIKLKWGSIVISIDNLLKEWKKSNRRFKIKKKIARPGNRGMNLCFYLRSR
jgi:hypothetical protein